MEAEERAPGTESATGSATTPEVTHVHCFHCYKEYKLPDPPNRKCDCGRAVEDGHVPPLRRRPAGPKEPPSLKATLLILGVVFLCLYPGVRWRFAEFNMWMRSILPYGGNPFAPTPVGLRPELVIIEARFGGNSELMSGHYYLLQTQLHGRSVWFKNAPGQEGYLLWDYCGAWLISRYPDGNSPKCEGWAYTQRCFGMPWECFKTWQIREDGNWVNAGASVIITPVSGKVSTSMDPPCSAEDEQSLIERAANFDVVIPWVNGSDPVWLSERRKACENWQWQEMWKDSVMRSSGVKRCLDEKSSVDEADKLIATGKCAKGALGKEGACAWHEGKKAPRGLTTRSSICYRRFVDSHCVGRLNSIKDHDELRFLIRSLERNLPWHTGNIFLVTPNKTVPSWLKEWGRLKVIAQEDLLRDAMSSSTFVPALERGRFDEWAPDRIFNDFPVEAALASLPNVANASRILMLLQDDLLFARRISICDFFTLNPFGLKLFARPYEALPTKDVYGQVYESMQFWSSKRFSEFSQKKDGVASTYYRDLHLPHMLDVSILEDLWRDMPELMSDSISSALRHPNLTSVIAMHHSEAARRVAKGYIGRANSSDTDDIDVPTLDYKVTNLIMNLSGKNPVAQRPWMEVVFESIGDWHERMARIPPNASQLPAMIGLQDNFGGDAGDSMAELDCLRERWLKKLLPGRSSFEHEDKPPSSCKLFKQSKGIEQHAKPETKEKTEL